jgi:hypothetical protein
MNEFKDHVSFDIGGNIIVNVTFSKKVIEKLRITRGEKWCVLLGGSDQRP